MSEEKVIPRWRRPGAPQPASPRSWASVALCSVTGGDWFPRDEGDAERAVCRVCPVQETCLTYALDAGETYGIWGGLTPDERRTLIHRQQTEQAASAAAHHRSEAA